MTLTVGANGKASGKFSVDGKTYVLSTSCYSRYADNSEYARAGDIVGGALVPKNGLMTYEDETFEATGTISCGSQKWPVKLTVRETGDINHVATPLTRASDVSPKGYGAWKLDTLMTIQTDGRPTGKGADGLDFSSELKWVK